jgi:hypothetical protein
MDSILNKTIKHRDGILRHSALWIPSLINFINQGWNPSGLNSMDSILNIHVQDRDGILNHFYSNKFNSLSS